MPAVRRGSHARTLTRVRKVVRYGRASFSISARRLYAAQQNQGGSSVSGRTFSKPVSAANVIVCVRDAHEPHVHAVQFGDLFTPRDSYGAGPQISTICGYQLASMHICKGIYEKHKPYTTAWSLGRGHIQQSAAHSRFGEGAACSDRILHL